MRLYILPLNFLDKKLLETLRITLENIFKIPVVMLLNSFPLDKGFDPSRNQVNSTWVLSQLLIQVPEEACKILGITSVDLFVPVLNYVFGEARLDGKTAVVSSFRLRDELYGLPRNSEKLIERLEKEAIHELGHTFGLIHCQNPNCVMYTSTYAKDIDYKSMEFCHNCSVVLERKKGELLEKDEEDPYCRDR